MKFKILHIQIKRKTEIQANCNLVTHRYIWGNFGVLNLKQTVADKVNVRNFFLTLKHDVSRDITT